ncbi:MAG TPA: ERCC4 domain-containing protein [Pirellulales bacterium]
MSPRLPAEIQPENITAVGDTREKNLLDLSPLKTVPGTLATGDYSVVGLEHIVAIERKSLSDLLGCIGTERERFDREVQRLLAYPVRALVVESTWAEINAGGWRGKVTPASVTGSVLGWVAAGLPVMLVGDHAEAGRAVARMLFIAARRRWREARALLGDVGAVRHD